MSRYFIHSRSPYYAVWCALPLLAVYEALLWMVGPTHGMQVRNAADVWLRVLLESLGLRPLWATLAMMGLLVLAIPALRRGEVRLEGRYLFFMFGEAVLYSLALGIVINLLLFALVYTWLAAPASALASMATVDAQHLTAQVRSMLGGLPPGLPLAMASARDTLTGIALSLGAGLFEEFAFRVVLLTVLLGMFRLILRPAWAALLAILLAALAFALAHYVGSLGEPLELHSLLFRFLAGLLFTLLYYQRGFAITAYAHALYDIWVLLI